MKFSFVFSGARAIAIFPFDGSNRSWLFMVPSRFFGASKPTSEGKCYLATELARWGTLQAFLERARLTEDGVRTIFFQLVHTILALHRMNMVHHDIKPDNILVTRRGQYVGDVIVKVTDLVLLQKVSASLENFASFSFS